MEVLITMTDFQYSTKYRDATDEYRIVEINAPLSKKMTDELLSEEEWREHGITQSLGWEHVDAIKSGSCLYYIFKRSLEINPSTGLFDKKYYEATIKSLKQREPWLFAEEKIK